MRRRAFLTGASALAITPTLPVRAGQAPSLLTKARALSAKPFVDEARPLPAPFAGLDYDAYRGIRPIPGRAGNLPHGADFAVDLLPPGLYFPDPVRIDIDSGAGPDEIAFSPALFRFQPRAFDSVPETAPGAGFSGLRLRHPLNAPDRMDEVLVVQGASYFRAIGRAMVYGLSARAVALGTGGPGPEEFPRFIHLRLHPARGGRVRLEGVIDSPSLAGHLDMTLRPGAETVMDLTVTLLPRRDIDDIGVAPLTSMFLKGPLRASVVDDFRPRVHDSDVLVIENGAGERLWRPITNPAAIEMSAFGDDGPARFGLYQSARAFRDYEDTEARYQDRPSAVVEPQSDWGPGAVVLVEIPTGDEFMDNVVAFWRPAARLQAGHEYRFAYALRWTRAAPWPGGPGRILQSRAGREHHRPGSRRYVIDFDIDAADMRADVSSQPPGAISGTSLFALPKDRGSRLTFLLTPGTADRVEVRAVLRDPTGRAATPIWLHRWTRARDGGG
jgi:glucans biosynthesis protein